MESILNGDYSLYAKLVAYALSILIPALVGVLIGYIKKKYNIEQINEFTAKLSSYKYLATMACRMAEQMYDEQGGAVKLEKAMEFVSLELAKIGVKMSPEEISSIVHSALRELKDELGTQWDKPTTKAYQL